MMRNRVGVLVGLSLLGVSTLTVLLRPTAESPPEVVVFPAAQVTTPAPQAEQVEPACRATSDAAVSDVGPDRPASIPAATVSLAHTVATAPLSEAVSLSAVPLWVEPGLLTLTSASDMGDRDEDAAPGLLRLSSEELIRPIADVMAPRGTPLPSGGPLLSMQGNPGEPTAPLPPPTELRPNQPTPMLQPGGCHCGQASGYPGYPTAPFAADYGAPPCYEQSCCAPCCCPPPCSCPPPCCCCCPPPCCECMSCPCCCCCCEKKCGLFCRIKNWFRTHCSRKCCCDDCCCCGPCDCCGCCSCSMPCCGCSCMSDCSCCCSKPSRSCSCCAAPGYGNAMAYAGYGYGPSAPMNNQYAWAPPSYPSYPTGAAGYNPYAANLAAQAPYGYGYQGNGGYSSYAYAPAGYGQYPAQRNSGYLLCGYTSPVLAANGW